MEAIRWELTSHLLMDVVAMLNTFPTLENCNTSVSELLTMSLRVYEENGGTDNLMTFGTQLAKYLLPEHMYVPRVD